MMMNSRQQASDVRFACHDVVADPSGASRVRHDIAAWLQQHFALDEARRSDVVLAVYEAVANAAEFAYLGSGGAGVMHVSADHDPAAAVLNVTVIDEGVWKETDPAAKRLARGRGIPLMHALADRAKIECSSAGTRVFLQWRDVTAGPAYG